MELDWFLLDKIQSMFSSGFMDAVMPKITALGNAGIVWIIMGLAMLISKKYRKTGFLVLIGLLLGLIIGNGFIKNIVARERPCWINTDISLLIPMPMDYSFPSGHTQSSVIAAVIITLNKKDWGWIVIPLAVLIAFSRLYLYVHFPSDVLGGAIIGIILGYVTFYAGNKIIESVKNRENTVK